ncbi:hypothetical protein DPMN_068106 [Dreissena polymorpha]|uniref:Uncharacterized protein n=1 Tax=Dreissena polymorpha TaxID=45954 RepID=A0A9D4BTY7_DREPO|nr:hypothetical protein DPMN_068106 [Dreissena polymorpha]
MDAIPVQYATNPFSPAAVKTVEGPGLALVFNLRVCPLEWIYGSRKFVLPSASTQRHSSP